MTQTNTNDVPKGIPPSPAQISELLDGFNKSELNLQRQVADGLAALKDAKVELTMHVTDKLLELNKTQSDLRDTGRAFSKRFDQNVEKQEKLLTQLNFYKWVIHILFVGVLGGSIVGITQFQPYIDSRIAGPVSEVEKRFRSEQSTAQSNLESQLTQKITQLERINQAFAYASTYDFFDAYVLISSIFKDVKSHLVNMSTDDKQVFYADVVWILSELELVNINGEWQGQSLWNELVSDEFFQGTDFVESEWLEAERQTQFYLALCYLKFEHDTGKALKYAKAYYEKAEKVSHLDIDKAPEHFGLAMLALIAPDKNRAVAEALNEFQKAEKIDPVNYTMVWFADNEAA